MAEELAYQHNEELDGARELMRKILAYGGIAPYRGGYLTEEYKDLPTKYKRKSGIPIDEIAQELGFREESSLVAAIEDAESTFQRMKSMQGRGKIRKFKTDDFLDMAWDRLVKEHQYRFSGSAYMGYIRNSKHKKGELGAYRKKIYGEEFFSPRQKELFQVLRRELIMKPEDIAKSADLIEACLERQGWEIKRVKQIQESISAKMTPDMFGKMQKLTGPEVMLQESIQRCLDMMRV